MYKRQAEAEAVRTIVSTTKSEDQQGKLIKQLPCYPLINERALSQLRKVDFEFQYYTRRVKSREEIWEEFQTNADYRAGKKLMMDYEFYELFDMVKDPAQKEVLAKAAMKLVKEPDGERPYALAAYELAKCYLQRGITDTLLLKPYLDWYLPPEREKVDHNGQSKGWFNDKAIMATQLIMYIKSQNYTAADNVYTYLYSLVQTGCHSLGCCREIFKKNGRYYWKSGCELDSQGQPVRHSKTCSRERQINELWKKIKNIYEQRTQP